MGIRDRLRKSLTLPPGATTQTAEQVAANAPMSGSRAVPLERPQELASLPFPAGMPLIPALINPPRSDGRADPRRYEFPVAINLQVQEQRTVPFRTLREVADAADIVRKCIEVVKSAVVGLEWDISINEDAIARVMNERNIGHTQAAKIVRDQYQAEVTAAKDFWRSPDRINGLSFQEWMGMLLEEVLVLDALSIYPNRTLGTDRLHSLEILDGSTIKPLLDGRGARPLPPQPAYQQILWGFPRSEFTASADADGEFTADDLIYAPRVRRPWTPYGYSPVERCLPLVDLYLKRLHWFRTEFTDGVIPDMLMESDMDFGNNPELIRGYEQVFNDALAGSLEQRRRMRLLPNGFHPVFSPNSDAKYSDTFDEFIVKSITGHFGVLPTQIGFTPASGLGGSGHQEGEANTAETIGLRPVITWVSDLLNQLSHRFIGMPRDLEFVFTNGTEEDEMSQATRRQAELFSGQKTWNEVRTEMGLPLFTFPEADAPIIVAAGQPMPLSASFEAVTVDAALQDNEAPDETVGEDEQEGGAPTPSAPAQRLLEEELEAPEEESAELGKFLKWARTEKARPFQFDAVPAEKAALLNALVAVDAAAARDLAATWKAGDARPKVSGGREPFPPNHPARAVSDRLWTIYTERLSSLGDVDADRLAAAWADAHDQADPDGWLLHQHLRVFKPAIGRVLESLYLEAAWMGTAAARSLIATQRRRTKKVDAIPTNWQGWTPGDPAKAALLLGASGQGSGLRDLLGRTNVTIANLSNTRIDMLGRVLAASAGAGSSVAETAQAIRQVVNNPVRAEMIAHTELTRAANVATMDEYKASGVSKVEWQTADINACDECAGYESDGPFDLDAIPAEPPAHPWCGCQLLPVEFDAVDTFQYTPDEQAELDAMDAAWQEQQAPEHEGEEPEAHANVDDQPTLATEAEVAETRLPLTLDPDTLMERGRSHPLEDAEANVWGMKQQPFDLVRYDSDGNYFGTFKESFETDAYLNQLAREVGFDKLPETASTEQVDRLVNEGWREVYRGFGNNEAIQAFVSGDYASGCGVYGSGWYTSTVEQTARGYAHQNPFGDSTPMRMALSPEANVVNYRTQLESLIDDLESSTKIDPRTEVWWKDEARVAALGGYDAIEVTRSSGESYIVVINRNMVVVDEGRLP